MKSHANQKLEKKIFVKNHLLQLIYFNSLLTVHLTVKFSVIETVLQILTSNLM